MAKRTPFSCHSGESRNLGTGEIPAFAGMTNRAVCFMPIVSANPQTLILGSMPGVKSLAAQQYYAHPQNGFWKIMGALFEMPVATYLQRVALIKKNRLALWDVLSTCERPGSLDSEIDPDTIEVNDFNTFLTEYAQITRVFFNGATAEKEFTRRVVPQLPQDVAKRLKLKRLPSTSPAHAGMPISKKIKEWSAVLSVLFCCVSLSAHAEDKKNECWAQSKSHALAVDCEAKEAKTVQASLDAQVKEMMAKAKREEADMKEAGTKQYDGLSRQLERSQKAFDAYKKAECEYEVATYGAGNYGGDAKPLFETNLMKQRIERLQAFKE